MNDDRVWVKEIMNDIDIDDVLGGKRYMINQAYSIIYSSNTGNTKLLAEALRTYLPQGKCCYFGNPNVEKVDTEWVFVGFWTDKGSADESILALLKGLREKKIFLFGTAGFGESEAYYKQILARIEKSVDVSCKIVGSFMCQGKMPMSVRKRYEMLKIEGTVSNVERMLANFDKARSHPDDDDVAALLAEVAAI